MEVNELMIGDWVQITHHHNPKPIVKVKQVDLIDFRNALNQIYPRISYDPIRITPEILEKNYGKETQVGISDKPCWGEMGAIWSTMLWKCENSFWLEVNTIASGFVKKHIRYVHELQHALRLAGIKKEIVL